MKKRFWQAVLTMIFMAGFYAFLTSGEIPIARAWLEMMLERFR